MASQRTSAAAHGAVRLLLGRLQRDSDAMLAAARAIPRATIAAATTGPLVGRSRAVGHVVARMPPPLIRDARSALWRLFIPAGEEGVVCRALVLGVPGHRPFALVTFGASFSLHALRRTFDRGGRAADPMREMISAHNNLMRVRSPEGAAIFSRAEILLPSHAGAFLCAPSRARTAESPMLAARSWIASDQAHADQEEQLKTWPGLSAA